MDGGRGWTASQHAAAAVAVQLSERKMADAEEASDPDSASRLLEAALDLRRRHCHRLSLLRYHAENEMCTLAMQAGQDAAQTAVTCARNVLAFLEMALGHVPWHPSLSTAQMRLASCEAAIGNLPQASELMRRCTASLTVTHGPHAALTQKAQQFGSSLRKSLDGCTATHESVGV
jgi:hypothetical protein